jgi:hypothetical protein
MAAWLPKFKVFSASMPGLSGMPGPGTGFPLPAAGSPRPVTAAVGVAEFRRPKQLEEENRKPKQFAVDLNLG